MIRIDIDDREVPAALSALARRALWWRRSWHVGKSMACGGRPDRLRGPLAARRFGPLWLLLFGPPC
jgi:hypothetical protein